MKMARAWILVALLVPLAGCMDQRASLGPPGGHCGLPPVASWREPGLFEALGGLHEMEARPALASDVPALRERWPVHAVTEVFLQLNQTGSTRQGLHVSALPDGTRLSFVVADRMPFGERERLLDVLLERLSGAPPEARDAWAQAMARDPQRDRDQGVEVVTRTGRVPERLDVTHLLASVAGAVPQGESEQGGMGYALLIWDLEDPLLRRAWVSFSLPAREVELPVSRARLHVDAADAVTLRLDPKLLPVAVAGGSLSEARSATLQSLARDELARLGFPLPVFGEWTLHEGAWQCG